MSRLDYTLFSDPQIFIDSLKEVTLSYLEPTYEQEREGIYIKLTIIDEGFLMTAFQCTGQDIEGNKVRVSIYNLPTSGTSSTMSGGLSADAFLKNSKILSKTILKPGTILLVKDPWFKFAMDGGTAIRIEDTTDIAILQSTSKCSFCGKTCETSACGNCRASFYCSRECQKGDWKMHKKVCKSYKENKEHHDKERSEKYFGAKQTE
jgi:hypothetical protein